MNYDTRLSEQRQKLCNVVLLCKTLRVRGWGGSCHFIVYCHQQFSVCRNVRSEKKTNSLMVWSGFGQQLEMLFSQNNCGALLSFHSSCMTLKCMQFAHFGATEDKMQKCTRGVFSMRWKERVKPVRWKRGYESGLEVAELPVVVRYGVIISPVHLWYVRYICRCAVWP